MQIKNICKKMIFHLNKRKLRNQKKLKKELTIVFVDEKLAKKINFYFRKKNYATDILSFTGEEEELG